MKVVVLYASQKGSTAEIATHITSRLALYTILADAIDVAVNKTLDEKYDAGILLTPIYKSMWLPAMTRFVKNADTQLANMPIRCLFPCIRVLEENGIEYAHDNYLPHTLLSRLNVQEVRFIAGKLLNSQLTHEDRVTLFERYDGKQLTKISGDYRDWDEIDTWLHQVATRLSNVRSMS